MEWSNDHAEVTQPGIGGAAFSADEIGFGAVVVAWDDMTFPDYAMNRPRTPGDT
jgi:hypothetical protein